MEPSRRSWCRGDERPPKARQVKPIAGRWNDRSVFDVEPVDAEVISAVLRSSEERLGAVAWAVAPRTLSLSVASPPATPYHALRIAAERYGFCPPPEADWAGSLQRLARELEDEHRWRIVW